MEYSIMCAVVFALTLGNLTKAAYSRKQSTSPYLFTALGALFSGIFFLCYNRFRFELDRRTIILSAAFAFCYLACDITTLLSMSIGSISVSSMISSFSLLIPTLFGIFYWHEAANALFWIGAVLFCVSVVLVNINGRYDGKKKKIDYAWLIYITVMFFANGGCSVFQTYHQRTGGAGFKAEFMIIAMTFVFASNGIISLFILKGNTAAYSKAACPYGMAYGLLNGGVNLGVMHLAGSGLIKQSVFFPVISAGSLVLVLIATLIIFKERLNKAQYAGIAVGIASIVLLQA